MIELMLNYLSTVETTTNPEGDRSDGMRINEAGKNAKSAIEVQVFFLKNFSTLVFYWLSIC